MIKRIQSAIKSVFFPVEKQAPIYIFDLDGTLSNSDARHHLVQGENPNWPAFFHAATRDQPSSPVMIALMAARHFGCEIRIWSGRSEEVREAAVFWLSQNLMLPESTVSGMLKMRPEGDFTPDDLMKERWLRELHHSDYMRIQAVYDDRQKVVDMWRRNNIPCFQVAPGDF